MSDKERINKRDTYTTNLSDRISFDAFDAIIENTLELLDFLGESAQQKPVINLANNCTSILTGDFLFATSKTLMSISSCCRQGCFADANILARKYRDDLFLYLYIIEADNKNICLTEDELNEIIGNRVDPEKFVDAVTVTMGIIFSGIRKEDQNHVVDAWFDNSAESGRYYKLLDINNYLSFLKRNPLVGDCIKEYGLEESWKKLGRKQNNYTHNNGRSFLTDNILTYDNFEKSEALLEQVSDDVTFITSFFLTILILIKPDYIASNEYAYYLDCDLVPPDGCQYWVAPIVQEYINNYVVSLNNGLGKYLRENNPYCMLID
ncbi:MAG: hypothetical protein VB076_11410 [Synergistaceae bacterium]|nr:hypothetical protein [Synergistaceae bacterium]